MTAIPEYEEFLKSNIIFYGGKERHLPEAAALIIRRMIEEDLVNTNWFPAAMDPYVWLSDVLHKSEKTIRGWTIDWTSSSGAKPTIIDFFNLIYLTRSQRPAELIQTLQADATPEELAKNHGDVLKNIAQHIIDVGEKVMSMVNEKQARK